jgi:hypothetical protein
LFTTLLLLSGLNSEMINGRCAMVGVFAAMVIEFTTGKSVWEQLTYRGGKDLVITLVFHYRSLNAFGV